jgi:hypothetical protein
MLIAIIKSVVRTAGMGHGRWHDNLPTMLQFALDKLSFLAELNHFRHIPLIITK